MLHKYSVADFFCGCGGLSEGFFQAGFDVVFSLDNWNLVKETHTNHPIVLCSYGYFKIKNGRFWHIMTPMLLGHLLVYHFQIQITQEMQTKI